MTGIEEILGALGASGAGAEAGGAAGGAAGTSAAAGAGGALTGLGGMGPEAAVATGDAVTGTIPSFSSEALPTSQAFALQRAGEFGNPAFAKAMSADATMTGSAGHMLPANTAKGGGGGFGDAMKGMMGGNSGQSAMDLMKIAASRGNTPPGTIPSLPGRQGGGTQPSIQEFLKLLQARRGPGGMMGR